MALSLPVAAAEPDAGQSAAESTAESTADSADILEEVLVQGHLTRYSATKSDTPILETARSVSIETLQQIIDKGALNLADTYVYSAGVTGEAFGFATRGDWLRVRGLDVPEYRDSLQALFSNYNNTRPEIYTVEQVEILKGPASVLYGQGSPGGLVNIVSKRPQERTERELVLEYGNFDRTQVAADLTGSIDDSGRWLYRLIGVYRDSDTQVDFIEDNTRLFAPSLTWRPTELSNITLLASYQETESDAGAQFLPIAGTLNRAPNGRRIDFDFYAGEPSFNRYDTKTTSLTLLADHQLNDTWSLEATARYTDGEADYQQAWTALIGGDRFVYNDDGSLYEGGRVPRSFYDSFATSEQQAVDVRLRANFDTGAVEHQVLVGAQYQDVTTEDDRAYAYALGYDLETGRPDNILGDTYWIDIFNPVYGRVPPQEIIDRFLRDGLPANTKDRGLYISNQISYADWRFTLGVRVDDVSSDNGVKDQDDDAVSTSVGVLYQFENGLSPYASFAESFQPVVGTNEDELLDPQEGRQYEVGVKYQPPGSSAFVTFAYFDIEQTNLADPDAVGGSFGQQKGVAKVKGAEIEGVATLADFTVEANLSYLDTENANGYQFASVPELQASTWIGYRPSRVWQGFKAGLGLRYVGESNNGTDSLTTPSYTLADLMIGYEMANWDFALNLRNLSDREYISTCLSRGDCFIGERRTVTAGVRYNF
ncbi:TonB-dependent siderophore receptor [Exilibacterium tricleocarpae]|uniref:TonB-dependent siderophore receptor n=2 Tax=Exilibacterium tricleocarpae TaxID=2591008 RepID=A0A545U5T7_9GAMM|nr:TonB-dependent siderophore receptor [Exilibacterium tricleocarpae]